MVKLIQRLLGLNNLRKIYNFSQIISLSKKGLEFQLIKRVPAKNILVLSPHPDDDAFALGGTLALSAKAGAKITTLILCQGDSGTKTGRKNPKLAAKRKKEALASARILGISEVIFWNSRDGKLAPTPATTKKLKNIIEKIKPEIIFLPNLVDTHPDHFATNLIFAKYLKKTNYQGQIWGYETWSPALINRLIEITSVWQIKKIAIKKHASQLLCRDYLGAMEGLNSYRGKIFLGKGLAEGFLALDQETYLKIVNKFL